MRGRGRRAVTLTVAVLCCVLVVSGFRWPWPIGGGGESPPQPRPRPARPWQPAPAPVPGTVDLTPPFAAATGLTPAGTSPAPPRGWTGGVVALTPDGRFVVHERPLDTAAEDGTLRHWPTRLGIAAPGGAVTVFRPATTDVAEVRRISGGDADAGSVVWREQPFRETSGGDQVVLAHDRGTGRVTELLRLGGSGVSVGDPVTSGGRAWWTRTDHASGEQGLWSVPLAGGTPRLEAAGGSLVVPDRCGTTASVLYARVTPSGDDQAAEVRRLGPGGDTLVHRQTLVPGGEVTGLAGCGGRIALGTGRGSSIVPPEFTLGRVLVKDAAATVEYRLPPGRVARALSLRGDRLGLALTGQITDPQQQLLVDLRTRRAASLGSTQSGDDASPITARVRFAGALVGWNEVVDLTYLRATAARLP